LGKWDSGFTEEGKTSTRSRKGSEEEGEKEKGVAGILERI